MKTELRKRKHVAGFGRCLISDIFHLSWPDVRGVIKNIKAARRTLVSIWIITGTSHPIIYITVKLHIRITTYSSIWWGERIWHWCSDLTTVIGILLFYLLTLSDKGRKKLFHLEALYCWRFPELQNFSFYYLNHIYIKV